MLRIPVFTIVIVLTLPFTLVYGLVYMTIMTLLNRRQGISGTTYEPFTGRLLMHDLGTREDAATAQLARALPATGPRLWPLISVPLQLAVKLSGYMPTVLSFPVARPPSLMALMTMRCEFFDHRLRDALETAEQVVILGAGWDTRLYSLPAGATPKCFEVDAPRTQQAKLEALAKTEIDTSHVTFVAADFNEQSWLEALIGQGFDPERPTFLLWEGVCMYLEPEAAAATLRSVAQLAEGSAIAFDYLAEELIQHKPPFRLLGTYFTAGLSLGYGEHLVFGLPMLPRARDGAARFVEAQGLVLSQHDALPQQGLIKTPIYGFILASVGQDRASSAQA